LQFFGSLVMSVQTPLQSTVGSAQEHVLMLHVLPPVHAVPHAPQLAVLVVVSTHAFTQSVRAGSHVALHALALQTSPALHLVTQAPQWSGSLASSAQTPPQSVAVGEVHTHIAFEHVKPAPQTFPHAPQLFGSESSFTHWPPQATLPFELLAPASPLPPQPPAVHVPERQTSPFAHLFPHAPQLRLSTVTSTQTLLHDSSPVAQPHLPAMHSWPF
jgi:hypothetical protein